MEHFDPTQVNINNFILFKQLYEKSLSISILFYERKTNESYKEILNFLKTKMKNLRLQSLIVDFECAAISAFSEIFTIRITTCFFHFTQIIWRKIQFSGKAKEYNENENFKFKIKQIIALAFVPFESLQTQLEILTDYFLNTQNNEFILNLLFWFQNFFFFQSTY
jgi:hypothetical protein